MRIECFHSKLNRVVIHNDSRNVWTLSGLGELDRVGNCCYSVNYSYMFIAGHTKKWIIRGKINYWYIGFIQGVII